MGIMGVMLAVVVALGLLSDACGLAISAATPGTKERQACVQGCESANQNQGQGCEDYKTLKECVVACHKTHCGTEAQSLLSMFCGKFRDDIGSFMPVNCQIDLALIRLSWFHCYGIALSV